MTRISLLALTLTLVACGGSSPVEPNYVPPQPRCVSNPALLASDAACVATVEPTPVALYLGSASTTLLRADSTYIGRAPYQPEMNYDYAHQWYQVPQVFVRLSNGDTRAANTHLWVPTDPSVLEVRMDAVDSFRGKANGCTKVRLLADGLETWIWVQMNPVGATGPSCK